MAVPTAVIFENLGLIILCGFASKMHLLFIFFEVAVQMFSVPNTAEKKIELKWSTFVWITLLFFKLAMLYKLQII